VLLLSIYKCQYYLPINVTLGLMMYATYFFLFAKLFYEMYLETRQESYVPPSKLKALVENNNHSNGAVDNNNHNSHRSHEEENGHNNKVKVD
jgi:hypothetical protein